MQCLNCGQPAGPHFCGHCGQATDDHRSPLLSLVRELVQESLSVDGRLFRTVKTLLGPGLLTRRFLDGKRAAYLSPVRLYLIASVALFSSLLAFTPPSADSINLYIAGELMNGPDDPARANITISGDGNLVGGLIADRYSGHLQQLKAMPPQEMLDRLFGGLRSVLPVALIAFVPFLALALKILYYRSHTLYVDHLAFSAHFQAALFLALAATWIVRQIASLPLLWAMALYTSTFLLMALWYLPRALQRVYQQRRWVTAVKTLALTFMYLQLLVNVVGLSVLFVLLRL